MNYTWYLIVGIILLIIGQITGYLRGLKDGNEIFGTLRMDHSDILERLEREHLLEKANDILEQHKKERYDWIEKLLEKYNKT